mmetsp:Transcript_69606/g.203728  ORF Transcript_69606/g.203728 Transcript_69606/m.203728 type:complete len:362 (+) Transcript_69606:3-1088(+)
MVPSMRGSAPPPATSSTATVGTPAKVAETAPVTAEASKPGATQVAEPMLLEGDPVAYDEQGRLVIARQCDDDGSARTIVENEDGTRKVFGANTVSSLLNSKEVDARRWVNGLTDRQVRALVHEFGHRLVHTSHEYTIHRKEFDHVAKQADYAYFGLSEGATEKDLSVAYRKMAKRMHPDKNGGTDEAKRRFQAMKEKYEHLKEAYRPQAASPEEADEEPEAEPERAREEGTEGGNEEGSSESRSEAKEGEDEQPCAGREESGEAESSPEGAGEEDEEDKSPTGDKAPHRQEAYDEDADEDEVRRKDRKRSKATSEDDKKIEYDPHDRQSLDKTLWKMIGQMRRLRQSLDGILNEIRRSRGC